MKKRLRGISTAQPLFMEISRFFKMLRQSRDTYERNINASFGLHSIVVLYSLSCHRGSLPSPPVTARKEQMMKNKFMAAGIIAALLVPAVAQARPQTNIYDRDRGVMVDKSRDHRDARSHDRRDSRHVQHRNDWRQDKRYGNFRAPFAYQRFQAGSRLKPSYYSHSYRQNWDNRWGLPRAGKNQSYVRHYNDLLLINDRNGKVVRVYRDLFRYR